MARELGGVLKGAHIEQQVGEIEQGGANGRRGIRGADAANTRVALTGTESKTPIADVSVIAASEGMSPARLLVELANESMVAPEPPRASAGDAARRGVNNRPKRSIEGVELDCSGAGLRIEALNVYLPAHLMKVNKGQAVKCPELPSHAQFKLQLKALFANYNISVVPQKTEAWADEGDVVWYSGARSLADIGRQANEEVISRKLPMFHSGVAQWRKEHSDVLKFVSTISFEYRLPESKQAEAYKEAWGRLVTAYKTLQGPANLHLSELIDVDRRSATESDKMKLWLESTRKQYHNTARAVNSAAREAFKLEVNSYLELLSEDTLDRGAGLAQSAR